MASKPMRIVFIASFITACYVAASPVRKEARSGETPMFTDSLRIELQAKTAAIFAKSCAVAGCHSGLHPRARLLLEPRVFASAVTDTPSAEIDSLKLIDTRRPERSYLVMKVRGSRGIKDERMPPDEPALSEEHIKTIELWAASLSVLEKSAPPAAPVESGKKKALTGDGEADPSRLESPTFSGNTLINLPTTETPGRGEVLFRISDRFIYPTNAGHEFLLGLDGPAYILMSLAYGVTHRVSVEVGRTNLLDEIELSSKVALLRQGVDFSIPFSAALDAGIALTTERPIGASLFDSDNMHFSAQLALSRRFTERFSLLCVPSVSSNTNYARPTEDNTAALGRGGRFMVIENVSLVGEWIPVLSGGKTGTDTWGMAVEARTGGHVFHDFVTNAYGLTPNQYIPGGDRNGSGDVRLGFNIYRTLWTGPASKPWTRCGKGGSI